MAHQRSGRSRTTPRSPGQSRTSTTPTDHFLPPSHYAAAAGLPYPWNRTQTANTKVEPDSIRNNVHLTPSQYNSRSMESHDSENRSQSRTSSRSKRKSSVEDLGQVEAHLLPSLKDTVDRMTRLPSQPMESSPQPHYLSGVARTLSCSSQDSGISSRSDLRKNNILSPPTPGLKHPALQSPSSLQSPNSPLPTRSIPRPKPKSILKSHDSCDRQQIHEEHDFSSNRARTAVRTPQQTSSGGEQSEQVYDGSTPQLPKTRAEYLTRTGRTRSRTEPGALTRGLSTSRGATIHQPNRQRSHIPRRVGMSSSPAPSRHNVSRVSDSGSEVGSLDPAHSGNRKLFITNAELVPSSSSEREHPRSPFTKSRIPSKRDDGQTMTAHLAAPRFGLGVGLTSLHSQSIVDTSTRLWSCKSPPAQAYRNRLTRVHDTGSSDGSCDVGDVGLTHYSESLCRNQGSLLNEDVRRNRSSEPEHSEDGNRVCLNEEYDSPDDNYGRNDGPVVSGSSSEEFEGRCSASEGSRVSSHFDYSDSGSEYSLEDEEAMLGLPNQLNTTPALRHDRVELSRDSAKSHSTNHHSTPKAALSSFIPHDRRHDQLHLRDPLTSEDLVELEASIFSSDEDSAQRQQAGIPSQRYSSEFSRIMAMSDAAAAHQREVFGISSLEGCGSDVSGLPHTDSDLSSVGGDRWQDPCDVATDSLLQQLTVTGREDSTDRQCPPDGFTTHHVRSQSSVSQDSTYSTQESQISMSASVTDGIPPTSSTDHRRSWSHLERRILDHYDDVEARRQRLVWELTESEEQFVRQLRNMIQLFILPLRVKDSRTWVFGVPSDICKLFDWLEDIVQVHAQLLTCLLSRRDTELGRLQSISEVFRAFIPKLETYQPYLVKLEFVATLIDSLVNEEKNDFGDFIKLQERSDHCEGWNLEKYLIEPVNRLAQYPELFRRLLQLTPKSHPDYFLTLSLFHAAKMTIRVLSEVKDREDEYERVKETCFRIKGIPLHLVKRERRLLMRGSLTFTEIDCDANGSPSDMALPVPTVDDRIQSPLETTPTTDRPRRSDRLSKAIKGWRGRSGSVRSTSTVTSWNSFSTAPSSFDIRAGQPGKVHGTPVVCVESEPEDVDVFIFTDLLLLTSPLDSDDHPTEGCKLKVRDRFGLSRVVSVTDEIDRRQCIIIDLVPLTPEELDCGGRVHPSGPVVTISLSYRPSRASVAEVSAGRVLLAEWLPPLRRCCQWTLKRMSSLDTKGFSVRDIVSDPEGQDPILSILASGLPFPKSPSMQIQESNHGETGTPEQREREERGWWSKRFHEVFLELSKQDIPV